MFNNMSPFFWPKTSPNPTVPAGVGALVDVAAANVCLEVLVAAIARAGVGAVAVSAGRVLTTVGQDRPGVPGVVGGNK